MTCHTLLDSSTNTNYNAIRITFTMSLPLTVTLHAVYVFPNCTVRRYMYNAGPYTYSSVHILKTRILVQYLCDWRTTAADPFTPLSTCFVHELQQLLSVGCSWTAFGQYTPSVIWDLRRQIPILQQQSSIATLMRSFDGLLTTAYCNVNVLAKEAKRKVTTTTENTHSRLMTLCPGLSGSVFTGQMPFLPPTQKCQNTESKTTTENKGGNSSLPSVLMIMIVLMTS